MNKLRVLPACILGLASLGFSASVFAETDPVTGVVDTTTGAVQDAGQGSMDAAHAVGKGTVDTAHEGAKMTHEAVKGTGDAVNAVGQGTMDTMQGKQ